MSTTPQWEDLPPFKPYMAPIGTRVMLDNGVTAIVIEHMFGWPILKLSNGVLRWPTGYDTPDKIKYFWTGNLGFNRGWGVRWRLMAPLKPSQAMKYALIDGDMSAIELALKDTE